MLKTAIGLPGMVFSCTSMDQIIHYEKKQSLFGHAAAYRCKLKHRL